MATKILKNYRGLRKFRSVDGGLVNFSYALGGGLRTFFRTPRILYDCSLIGKVCILELENLFCHPRKRCHLCQKELAIKFFCKKFDHEKLVSDNDNIDFGIPRAFLFINRLMRHALLINRVR